MGLYPDKAGLPDVLNQKKRVATAALGAETYAFGKSFDVRANLCYNEGVTRTVLPKVRIEKWPGLLKSPCLTVRCIP
jgi:hypothetical protein